MKTCAVSLTLLFAFHINCLYAEEPGKNLSSVFLGVGASYSAVLAGGFDGMEYYSSGDDFLLPVYNPEPGFGWEIEVGYDNGQGLSFALGASQTYHQARWQAANDFEETGILTPGEKVDTRTSSSIFYTDIKQNLLPTSRFQPYWRAGVGFAGTSSEEGYLAPNKEVDGGFGGVSLRAGFGLEAFISPQFSFLAEGVYQFGMYNSAEWDSGSASIEPWLFVHEVKPGVRAVYRYPLSF